MHGRSHSRIVPAAFLAVLSVVAYQRWQPTAVTRAAVPASAGTPGGAATSREGLEQTVAALDAHLASEPGNGLAAARLADALLRQARVTGNPGLAVRAEQVLRTALDGDPDQYAALRMLGATLAAQHRFRDAIATADRARRLDPEDAWHYGVLGDAHLELGEYDEAFAAFDEMMRRRPTAAAYARASYAREIQGDLDEALRLMQMARDATSAHDPESQAWHDVQIGDLHLQMGRLGDAERQYRLADFTFAGHPLAVAGLARVETARGQYAAALRRYETLAAAASLPEYFARIGELQLALGLSAEATRSFALAENGWRHDTPEPAHLARLLATHDRHLDEALAIAERAAATRRDIDTMDALAWAAFKAGQLGRARDAIRAALRTGTRNRVILYHAAAIHAALGEASEARELARRALDRHPSFDPVLAPAAQRLLASR